MRPSPPVLALAFVVAASPLPEARACGGFFCDNINPVVQTAERILFRINDDDTTTVIVEIQYQGPPSNFGWVLPVAPGLTTEKIDTAPAGLFDALEERTAPVFEVAPEFGAGVADEGSGCGTPWRRRWSDGSDFDPPPPPDTSGVEVVGEAVVGPYAIEIITAEKAENLSNWLILNNYQIPQSAIPAMDHYLGLGMDFIGVKLQADVPEGPIDALSFTVPGTTPSIPLVLTSIAAASEMEIVAYVAGPGRYVPGNWIDLAFDYSSVSFVDEGETDYLSLLVPAIDEAGGKAWNTECAGLIAERFTPDDALVLEVLDRDRYLTRFHTFLSPWEMTEDPWWTPSTEAEDVDNHHFVDASGRSGEIGPPRGRVGAAAIVWVLIPALAIRRRRP